MLEGTFAWVDLGYLDSFLLTWLPVLHRLNYLCYIDLLTFAVWMDELLILTVNKWIPLLIIWNTWIMIVLLRLFHYMWTWPDYSLDFDTKILPDLLIDMELYDRLELHILCLFDRDIWLDYMTDPSYMFEQDWNAMIGLTRTLWMDMDLLDMTNLDDENIWTWQHW